MRMDWSQLTLLDCSNLLERQTRQGLPPTEQSTLSPVEFTTRRKSGISMRKSWKLPSPRRTCPLRPWCRRSLILLASPRWSSKLSMELWSKTLRQLRLWWLHNKESTLHQISRKSQPSPSRRPWRSSRWLRRLQPAWWRLWRSLRAPLVMIKKKWWNSWSNKLRCRTRCSSKLELKTKTLRSLWWSTCALTQPSREKCKLTWWRCKWKLRSRWWASERITHYFVWAQPHSN